MIRSTSSQLPGNEDRAITTGVSLGIEDPYFNQFNVANSAATFFSTGHILSHSGSILFINISRMTYEYKETAFNPGLQSYKAMIWATQGAVFPNSNIDEFTSSLLGNKAMIWATPGTVFSIPNSDAITSTLLNGKAMLWAIPGAVFSNISLEIGITVSTEDKPTAYDEMLEARVAKVHKNEGDKVQGFHQQLTGL